MNPQREAWGEAIDLAKRELLLQEGVDYLTKCEQLLPMTLEKVCTFGTSELSQKTSATGRPHLPADLRVPRDHNYLEVKTNNPYFEAAGLWPQSGQSGCCSWQKRMHLEVVLYHGFIGVNDLMHSITLQSRSPKWAPAKRVGAPLHRHRVGLAFPVPKPTG